MTTSELHLEIMDIETFYSMFLMCSYDAKEDKRYQFEISSRVNQIDALVKHLKEHKRDFFVTYNGISFDVQVLQFISNKTEMWLDLDFSWQQMVKEIICFILIFEI